MTELEAIDVLKMEQSKIRTDFYPDRKRAIDKAIEALYFLYVYNSGTKNELEGVFHV